MRYREGFFPSLTANQDIVPGACRGFLFYGVAKRSLNVKQRKVNAN